MDYIILLISFVLLVKGADFFVGGSVNIAKKFNIPEVIIGLTVVALGTSAPEFAVSVSASLAGQNSIAISNVIGSNIFNILLVLGITSVIKPCKVDKSLIQKDIPFSFIITVMLLILILDIFIGQDTKNMISRADGFILLLLFCMFLYYTIRGALKNMRKSESGEKSIINLPKSLVIAIVGLAGIVFGGKFVVTSATNIANSLGVSQTVIGLTIVACGTGLPELVTSIVAAKKGNSDVAIGNVVGSNIFNILFVLGASSAIHPFNVDKLSLYDITILLGITLLFCTFAYIGKKITRIQGIFFVFLFVIYNIYILVR
jgi:K+-dependent Na+/Ca+ exchanger related-protein